MKITFKIEFTRPWSSAGWYERLANCSWSEGDSKSYWSRTDKDRSESWSASLNCSWDGFGEEPFES